MQVVLMIPVCVFCLFFCGYSQQAKTSEDHPKGPVLIFENGPVYHFDTIIAGPPLKVSWKIKNVGTEDLIIESVKGNWPNDWPKTPIPPGGSATIRGYISTKGRKGMRRSSSTIRSNCSKTPIAIFSIEGYIKSPNR